MLIRPTDIEERERMLGAGAGEIAIDDGRDGLVVGTARFEREGDDALRLAWIRGPWYVDQASISERVA